MEFKSKLTYVATPYRHKNYEVVDMRVEAVKQVVAAFTNKGDATICPVLQYHSIIKLLPTDEIFWKTLCLSLLSRCDEMVIVQFDDYETSAMLHQKIMFTEQNNIKILFTNPDYYIDSERYTELTEVQSLQPTI